MKMATEDYERIVEAFRSNLDLVTAHYRAVQQSEKFRTLEVRVGWDCLHCFLKGFALEQYDKGLHDSHITTALVKALKELEVHPR